MNKIDYTKILVAGLNLDIDYKLMTRELLTLIDHPKCIKFSYPTDDTTEVDAYSIFLRECGKSIKEINFRNAKSVDFKDWFWDKSLSIPYTQSIIDQIPFNELGTVRVVFFPNVPCIEHTDWDDSTDAEHTLGISIIPDTAGVSCSVWSESSNQYVSVPSNAMLLNDSVKHYVDKTKGTRITLRMFGKIDYSWFDDKIIQDYCYYSD